MLAPSKRSILAIAFVYLCFAATLVAQDVNALNTEFKQLFEGKVVTLRSFDSNSYQKYDANGAFEGKHSTGPWTLFSKLKITTVDINKDRLLIRGKRVFVRFDPGSRELHLLGSEEPLQLDVRLSKPLSSESIKKELANVLVHSGESLADLVPAYWHAYFQPELHPIAGDPKESGAPTKEDEEKAAAVAKVPTQRVRISSGVAAGNLIKKVIPEYPEFAKSFRQSGYVVLGATIDATGSIENLQVMQPAGFGLDEAAVDAVQKWKYKPYTLNGAPVEVETQITVNFNLSK